jgi:hypothetical protein
MKFDESFYLPEIEMKFNLTRNNVAIELIQIKDTLNTSYMQGYLIRI